MTIDGGDGAARLERPDSVAAGARPGADSSTGAGSATDRPAVAVEDLRKVYGGGEVSAVDGVCFEIEPGTAVGLLGPNGAGKTTTIKSLLGLVVPTGGSAEVFGVDVHDHPRIAYRRMAAMLEGARNVYWRLTVRENLEFFTALAGHRPGEMRDRHDALLSAFDLDDRADTPVRELSRGMQQKVSMITTLGTGADVVFLDEPTLGLDVESTVELRQQLRRVVDDGDVTLLVSSHDMDVVEDVCDRAIIMSDGRIVADDTVANLLDLFRTQTYRIRVGGAVDPTTRRELESAFDATDFERHGDGVRFLAQVTGEEFYELADTLRAAGHTVAGVDSVEPDLEEVFLHVTDGSDGS